MSFLSLKGPDVKLVGDVIQNWFPTPKAKPDCKYVVVYLNEKGDGYEIEQMGDKKNLKVKPLAALQAFQSALLDTGKTIAMAKTIPVEGAEPKVEITASPVLFPGREAIGNYILIGAAAQKIQQAVNAKVSWYKKLADWVWSLFTCKQSELQKINKVYADIIKICQTEYAKLAPAEAPKAPQQPEPAKT